jgi:DNA topoisomerase IA
MGRRVTPTVTRLGRTIMGSIGRCQHAALESLTELGRKAILFVKANAATSQSNGHFRSLQATGEQRLTRFQATLIKKGGER